MEEGLSYRYKDEVEVGPLGMVDDLLAVTQAGYMAHEMNGLFNIKSAEKRLQFNVSKCKTILVGKKTEQFHENKLYVDEWKTTYTPIKSCDVTSSGLKYDYCCDKPVNSCDKFSSCCDKCMTSCDNVLNENYVGKIQVEQVKQHKYLGHFISNSKNNSAHIEAIKINPSIK